MDNAGNVSDIIDEISAISNCCFTSFNGVNSLILSFPVIGLHIKATVGKENMKKQFDFLNKKIALCL